MRVVRMAWVLTMTFAALVVVVAAVGGMQPKAQVVGVLSPDCPMPCWQGIQPGITDADTAISLLSLSPFVDTRYMTIGGTPGGDFWQIAWSDYSRRSVYLWGTVTLAGDTVQRIDVNFSSDWPATIEEVIGLLGMPPYLSIEDPLGATRPRTGAVRLYYPQAGLEIAAYRPVWDSALWTAMRVGRLTLAPVDPDRASDYWDSQYGAPYYE